MSSSSSLPSHYRKIVVTKLSNDFRAATQIQQHPLPVPDKDQVLVRIEYAGINASDINYTAGKYTPGAKPPLDAGFEAVGTILSSGPSSKLPPGQSVGITSYGAFSEYMLVSSRTVIPLPTATPAALPLLVSGLTASIALEQVGELKKGEVVLVTAAAGGTGLFAVQLAKLAGAHVIGTCSSADKVDMLRSLGCDRVVNYKTESLHEVLKQEYKKGIDVVYESVGGAQFQIAVRHLAVKGRLIVIGAISGYVDQSAWKPSGAGSGPAPSSTSSTSSLSATDRDIPAIMSLPLELLRKSSSVRGFFLNDYTPQWKPHLTQLMKSVGEGKLQSVVDPKEFVGLEAVADAIEWMYKGKNVGKVVVKIGSGGISSSL